MLRVLTLSTLFPDATRPNFGIFVERQTQGLARHPDVVLQVVAPVGTLPWPLSLHSRYRARTALPLREDWRGLDVRRPRFTAMPATSGRFYAGALVRALKPLLTEIRNDFPFDVIDAEFFFPDGPAAVALGKAFGVPVSIKARGADIHHWGEGATAGQVLRAGQAADGLLAVSAAMRADMAALGIPDEKIRVHRTGVDLARFAPRDRAAAKATLELTGPVVVSLGALIPRKGHDIVLRAVADIPGATLLIVGEGEERGRLEAEITRLGASARLLGSVAHDELPAILAAADVMALASSSEGLANAWVEALATGVPVVITDAGGARELVDRPEAGRVVARTADAFRGAIGDLLAHPSAPLRVRKAAERYTWEANTAALYDHLAGLVAKRSRMSAGSSTRSC